MRWVIRAYVLVMMIYTGWRTWDFMFGQLPPDNWLSYLLAFLYLFASEIGLLLWHEASINHVTTETQYYLAVSFTWIDFVGGTGAGIADMIKYQTMTEFVMPTWAAMILSIGMPLIVAGNIAAALLFLANDAAALDKRARTFNDFAARRAAHDDIANNRGRFAKENKKHYMREIYGGWDYEQPDKPALPAPAINGNTNGHRKEKIEFDQQAPVVKEINPTKARKP